MIHDFNKEDLSLSSNLRNESTCIVFTNKVSSGKSIFNTSLQLLYKLKLPKCKFEILHQSSERITLKVGKKLYSVRAKSMADWLVIDCQNVMNIGEELFNFLINLTNCDSFVESQRVLINKNNSKFIDIVTEY